MYKPKYITFKEDGLMQMVIFPNTMIHALVARRLCGRDRVVSAGFVQFGVSDNDEPIIHCYGESESLDVKSRPEDSALAKALYINP